MVGERSNGDMEDALAGLMDALEREDVAGLRKLLFAFIAE